MEFKIGIYEKAFPEYLSLREMLQVAKDVGYDFFQMSIDRTDTRIQRIYDEKFIAGMKQTIIDTDLSVGSICLSALSTYTLGNLDEGIHGKAVDIFKNTVLFAEKLGARIIQIPACDMPKSDIRDSFTDRRYLQSLKLLVEFAAAHGIMVGIENMENDYMNTIEKCMRLINEVNSPYFQLYPDSGNTMIANLKNRTYKADMYCGQGHYIGFHLKEAREEKFGGLFYGEGVVDFDNLVKYSVELGARRFVMEYWYTGNPKWKTDLVVAKQKCIDWIEGA